MMTVEILAVAVAVLGGLLLCAIVGAGAACAARWVRDSVRAWWGKDGGGR
jgi:hypothetical protein